MSRKVLRNWLLIVLFLGLSGRVRAAEEAVQPYVVLVGIDRYADKQILPRKTAEADAKALYDVFTSPDHLGVDAGGDEHADQGADRESGAARTRLRTH